MIYNYADHLLSKVIEKLVHDSLLLIQWFADNHMKETPEKFNQVVAVGECTYKENISFNLDNNVAARGASRVARWGWGGGAGRG